MENDPFKIPMTTQISGLKCDNAECDYRDEDIPGSDYEQHINKPCPNCGENLLTQDDYDKVQQIQKQVMDLNDLFGDMKGMGMPMGDSSGERVKLDLSSFLGGDENMNEEIKRFNDLI